MPDWQEAAAIYSDLKKKKNLWVQKTWAAAESAFHILGWQGWNVLASLRLCDPSPSMLGTRNNQIFHESLKRHGKQLAAIWQPQTNKSQNLVAAKNNSVL